MSEKVKNPRFIEQVSSLFGKDEVFIVVSTWKLFSWLMSNKATLFSFNPVIINCYYEQIGIRHNKDWNMVMFHLNYF